MPAVPRLVRQRKALTNASSGILTLGEVAEELCIEGIVSPMGGGAHSATDALNCIGEAGPVNAAMLLSYARVAWLCEEVLVVDLGERVRERQTKALRLRLRVSEDGDLPLQSTNLCVCCECKRVANAYATSASDTSFNELGVSASQVAVNAPDGNVRLHCARRSSAALRSAVAFETEMKCRCIEAEHVDRMAVARVTSLRRDGGKPDSGAASRVRRDAKSAFEQHPTAVPCGQNKMFTIPILGRAIRVYKSWYALCCNCACMIRVQPHLHRYGSDLCCLRCDHTLFGIKIGQMSAVSTTQKICRYCGSGASTQTQTIDGVLSDHVHPVRVRSRKPQQHGRALERGKGTARHCRT